MDPWLDPRRFLPHHPPMVLLDRFCPVSAEEVRAEWRVPSGGPWVRNGSLARSALVEVAAQAIAAGAGHAGSADGPRPVPGVLGALNSVRFRGSARPGDLLTAVARVGLRYERFLRVSFAVESGGSVLCEGEMTLSTTTG